MPSKTLVFGTVIIVLLLVTVSTGLMGYSNTNTLQAKYDKLETDYQSLNSTYIQLQAVYASLNSTYIQLQSAYDNSVSQIGVKASSISQLESQVSSLNQQVASLNQQLAASQNTVQSQTATVTSQASQMSSLQSQITTLNNNIASLQSQLSNATALIVQLQGPTGILPTYMDLHYVAPTGSPSYYFLQLSLKNTGPIPVTQIFVTINSQKLTMPFTYLDSTVSASTPLPAYQTATGNKDVTPPVNWAGTYPIVIQAVANNGTIYTYQTTIST